MKMQWAALVLVVAVVGVGRDVSAADDPMAEMAAACPCDATAAGTAWTSHGQYVACVVQVARQLRRAGRLAAKPARAAMKAARQSTCGTPSLTRCCVYKNDDDDVGQCRMLTAATCDALDSQMDTGGADDLGSGSCVPNPCAF